MKTNHIVKSGVIISSSQCEALYQRTIDKYYNATKLVEIYNERTGKDKRIDNYLASEPTKELIISIAELQNIDVSSLVKTTRGKNGGTWMHPHLFLDFMMFCDSKLHAQALDILWRGNAIIRDASGDSYKDMMTALKEHYRLKFPLENPSAAVYENEALMIQRLVGVPKDVNWDTCNAYQLGLRDVLHAECIVAHKCN